jgi:hypothetical protein
MEKSTILGIGLLSVVGVGAYIYLKGKKSTTPISSSSTSTNTTSDTSSSVVNSSLGLPTTKSPSAEEQKNYLEAKDLARLLLLYNAGTQNDEFKLLATKYGLARKGAFGSTTYVTVPLLAPKKINALGYKVLPNFDIEKM